MIKNTIKKVLPIIFSCLYLFCLSFFTGNVFVLNSYELSIEMVIISLVLAAIASVAILIEMIIFMVHAGKNKEINNNGIWIVLIYMFNVFIIPYYNLKYVCKEEKIKVKTIIYVILLILSCVLGFSFVKHQPTQLINDNFTVFKTQDERVSFSFKDSYIKRIVGEYDLYVSDQQRQINFGVFTYDLDIYDTNPADILYKQENYIIETRKNVKYIDNITSTYNDKIITTHVYSGESNNTECIYRFSTITFTDDPNYFIYVIQITLSSQYDNQVDELIKILESAELDINNI